MLSSVLMLPHGAEIIAVPQRSYNEGFRPLHVAMRQAASNMAVRDVELIFMLTPHGYSLQAAYNVYLHNRLLGVFTDLSESNVYGEIAWTEQWAGDVAQGERLLGVMRQQGMAADGLIYGNSDYPLPLGWGESVPLHYIGAETRPRLVIIALPRTRFDHLGEMQHDLVALGRILYEAAQRYPGNVAIVSSADLAHTHSAQGIYGFHESAAPFDTAVQQWAKDPQRATLDCLLSLQPTAKACGMAGMCVLQEILEAAHCSCRSVTYAAPTYFGMAVVEWT